MIEISPTLALKTLYARAAVRVLHAQVLVSLRLSIKGVVSQVIRSGKVL